MDTTQTEIIELPEASAYLVKVAEMSTERLLLMGESAAYFAVTLNCWECPSCQKRLTIVRSRTNEPFYRVRGTSGNFFDEMRFIRVELEGVQKPSVEWLNGKIPFTVEEIIDCEARYKEARQQSYTRVRLPQF